MVAVAADRHEVVGHDRGTTDERAVDDGPGHARGPGSRPDPPGVEQTRARRRVCAGGPGAPIPNGLGPVQFGGLFLLFGKTEPLLTAAGLEIVEPECGELVPSLDMSGLSLTLFWLDPELEQFWSAPADTPGAVSRLGNGRGWRCRRRESPTAGSPMI